jgi:type I restriction enzyme, S subunit
MFPPETLLIAMYGATIGKLGILKTEATTNQACCALFFHPKKWNTKFFFYYFLSIRKKLIFSSYGGGQPNISQEIIKQERLFAPGFKEQNKIAEYLDDFCDKISKERGIIEQQIEKLKQYRKCLIHECVTGKRKVVID